MDTYKAEQDRLALLARQDRERAAKYAATSVDGLYQTVNNGDVDAQMNLGMRYLEGKGVDQDEHMGVEYLSKAAARGHKRALAALRSTATPGLLATGNAEAAFALGQLYATGQGVTASDADALTWFSLAAKLDYPGAVEMAKTYDTKVLNALRKLAEQGDIAASMTLAKRYIQPDNGTGFGVNQAIPLLIRVAGLGNTEALELLTEQATPGWFSDGNINAAFALGEMFFKGIGVVANSATATYWYEIAARQGVQEAKRKLTAIKKTAVAPSPPISK